MRAYWRKLGHGEVLIQEISHKVLHLINSIRRFEDDLCVSSASQIHIVSSLDCWTTIVCFCSTRKNLIDCLIEILFPAQAAASAVRRFIDKLTLPLQQLH